MIAPSNLDTGHMIEIIKDPVASAKAAGLRYINDDRPGISRTQEGDQFKYLKHNGQAVEDPAELERIKKLGIPPAYTNVWISPIANGHLQATGRDAKNRKQYRYHARWREVRDENKYGRMLTFGEALPALREQVERDLKRPGLNREKVLAAVVRLLETTLIRVGNEEYAKTNKSFGLTTMRDRHVAIEGATVRFKFKGKSGVKHDITLNDRRVANIVKRCRDIPGQELFQYMDDDNQHQTIDSADVNNYLREISGQDFTAKDFRTWFGTVVAAKALSELEKGDTATQQKKNISQAIEAASQRLGNTPTICRKCYVHPAILEAYQEGFTIDDYRVSVDEDTPEKLEIEEQATKPKSGLAPDEVAVMELLKKRLQLAA